MTSSLHRSLEHTSIAIGAIAVLAFLAGCTPPTVGTSSTILLDGDRLLVTSPDDDTVVSIDAQTLTERTRYVVAGGPQHLVLVDRVLYVTRQYARGLVAIALDDDDSSNDRGSETIPISCGGSNQIVRSVVNGRTVVITTCTDDNRLSIVDVERKSEVIVIELPGTRPESIVARGAIITVGLSGRGALLHFDLAKLTFDAGNAQRFIDVDTLMPEVESLSDAVSESPTVTVGVVGQNVTALWTDTESTLVTAAFSLTAFDDDRTRPPEHGGYGALVDGAPRIEPRLHGACGGGYARFDGSEMVHSGPSALAKAGDVVVVAHTFTDTVALISCENTPRHIASFRTGRGPRGLAVGDDGKTVFVDVGFAHAIAKLRVPDAAVSGTVLVPELEVARGVVNVRLSAQAERGRAIFHDAVDTQLTPSGVVACATCHPNGGQDSLVWFLHTEGISRRVRRTRPAWAAKQMLAPFHWDNEFLDAESLVQKTVTELMNGRGLLVDYDAVRAYLDEVPPPLARLVTDSDVVARGRAHFESAAVGCSACHVGEVRSDGVMHDVIAVSVDTDGHMPSAATPPLVGIRARAPYLHDGRAATLYEVVRTHNQNDQHGNTSQLSDDDIAALLAFLESL